MIPMETELNNWSTTKRNTFHTDRINFEKIRKPKMIFTKEKGTFFMVTYESSGRNSPST